MSWMQFGHRRTRHREDQTNEVLAFESVGGVKLKRTTTSNRESQRVVSNGREIMIDNGASEHIINDSNHLRVWRNIGDMRI